jgi:predicted cobalt transporter CbtA
MTPRAFAGVLGAIAIIVAIAFLTTPVSLDDDAIHRCGTVLSPTEDQYSDSAAAACEDAVGDRRAWTVPVGIAGLVVVAGALVVKPRRAAGDSTV